MLYLTGFVIFPTVPEPVTVEFWDRTKGVLLVSHTIAQGTGGLPYQFYFPDDYPLGHLDDLDMLLTEEIEQFVEIIPRFGDRNRLVVR